MKKFRQTGVLNFSIGEKVFLSVALGALFSIPFLSHWGVLPAVQHAVTPPVAAPIDRSIANEESLKLTDPVPASVQPRMRASMFRYHMKVQTSWLRGEISDTERDRRIQVMRKTLQAESGDRKTAYDFYKSVSVARSRWQFQHDLVLTRALGHKLGQSEIAMLKRIGKSEASVEEYLANEARKMRVSVDALRAKGAKYNSQTRIWNLDALGSFTPQGLIASPQLATALGNVFGADFLVALMSPKRKIVATAEGMETVFLPPRKSRNDSRELVRTMSLKGWKNSVTSRLSMFEEARKDYKAKYPGSVNWLTLLTQGGDNEDARQTDAAMERMEFAIRDLKRLGFDSQTLQTLTAETGDLAAERGELADLVGRDGGELDSIYKAGVVGSVIAAGAFFVAGGVGAGAASWSALIGGGLGPWGVGGTTSLALVGSQAAAINIFLVGTAFTGVLAAGHVLIDQMTGRPRSLNDALAYISGGMIKAMPMNSLFMFLPVASAGIVPVAARMGVSTEKALRARFFFDSAQVYAMAVPIAMSGSVSAYACAQAAAELHYLPASTPLAEREQASKNTWNICGKAGVDVALAGVMGTQMFRAQKAAKSARDAQYRASTADEFERVQLEQAFATLGLKPGATQSEVNAAYRALAKRYHPDQYASKAGEFTHGQAAQLMSQLNASKQLIAEYFASAEATLAAKKPPTEPANTRGRTEESSAQSALPGRSGGQAAEAPPLVTGPAPKTPVERQAVDILVSITNGKTTKQFTLKQKAEITEILKDGTVQVRLRREIASALERGVPRETVENAIVRAAKECMK